MLFAPSIEILHVLIIVIALCGHMNEVCIKHLHGQLLYCVIVDTVMGAAMIVLSVCTSSAGCDVTISFWTHASRFEMT